MARKGTQARLTKEVLREEMRERLKGIPPIFVAHASRRIAEQLAAMECWIDARAVYVFNPPYPFPDVSFWDWSGKRAAIPRLVEGRLVFSEMANFPDVPRDEGGRVLLPEEIVPAFAPDLILVPGLAFTDRGQRLGNGGGSYNEFFAKHPSVPRIGICYERQIRDFIPYQQPDALMDAVVTEQQIHFLAWKV